MINEIYTSIMIALTSVLFVLGLVFYVLSRNAESPVFKKALRMMIFTYCYFGLICAMELWSMLSIPESDDEKMVQIIVLIIAVSQAFLFTYTLILLIHASYVTRRRMMREIITIFSASAIVVILYFILPVDWIKIAIYLFVLFYVYLLIKYTRLFLITYRECLRKMDSFFSGQEAERLKWIRFSFFAALSIGLLALADSLMPTIENSIICTVVYFLFYLYFAFRLVNYGFIFKKIEAALSDDDEDLQFKQFVENDCAEQLSINKTIETNLNIWIKDKQFLQPSITIQEVARQLGTNRTYLSEYINSVKKISFRQYINELRIEDSKSMMLQNPKMPLSEIALQVGYTDKSHFIRLFSKITGGLPKEWRERNVSMEIG
jgi:AraC-like DNA-binding protein